MIRITKTPFGPQLRVCGRRFHHFDFAFLALAFAAWAFYVDRKDLADWLLHARR